MLLRKIRMLSDLILLNSKRQKMDVMLLFLEEDSMSLQPQLLSSLQLLARPALEYLEMFVNLIA